MKTILSYMVVVLYVVAIVGWVMNIYKFATSDFETPYKSEIIRGVGIPVGVMGAITGYMTIGDEK